MKKLLSLLSILTISGTAVPTTIATSPYEKEETLDNYINSEKSNLENLKRNKRQNCTNQLGGYQIQTSLNTGIWATSGSKLRANASKEKVLERFKAINQNLPLNLNLVIYEKSNNFARIGIAKDFGITGFKDVSCLYW